VIPVDEPRGPRPNSRRLHSGSLDHRVATSARRQSRSAACSSVKAASAPRSDSKCLGVCLVLERRLTQILVDVPDALSIGQRGREQGGVPDPPRVTSVPPRPRRRHGRFEALRHHLARSRPRRTRLLLQPEPPTLRGAPSTCARASRGPTNPGSRSSRVPARGRRSREPLEPTHDVAVQYLHQRDGPPLLEVESHGLPIDISDAAQHVADGGEPGDRRRIDVRPLAA